MLKKMDLFEHLLNSLELYMLWETLMDYELFKPLWDKNISNGCLNSAFCNVQNRSKSANSENVRQ